MGLFDGLGVRLPRIRSSNPEILALAESAEEIEATEAGLMVFLDDRLDEPVILRNTMIAEIPEGTVMDCLEDGGIDMGGLLPNVLPLKKYNLIPPGNPRPESAVPVPDGLVGPLPRVKPSVGELQDSIQEVASFARV